MNNNPPSLIQLATPAAASKPLSPLSKGLTVIAVEPTDLLHPVKAAITQALLSRSKDLSVPMPELDVVREVIVGSPRYLDYFKAQELDREAIKGEASYAPFYWPSNSPMDWTDRSGLMLIEQSLKGQSKAAVVLVQHGDISSNGLLFEGLLAAQLAARSAKSYVVIVAALDPLGAATCARLANEFLTAKKCEPDPDFDDAFILDCEALSQVPALGQGKVTCNFKLTARGYEFGFTPFVSEHVDVRLMAILKALGMTLKEIGGVIHKDKSNVSRDLKGVPLLKKVAFTEEDLARWLECCGKGPEQIRQSLILFSEWEKAQVVAQPAQEMRNDRNARNTARKPR